MIVAAFSMLAYTVVQLKREVRKMNATIIEGHKKDIPTSNKTNPSRAPQGEAEKVGNKDSGWVGNESNKFYKFVDDVMDGYKYTKRIYSTVYPPPWDRSVYVLSNSWVNKTATHTLQQLVDSVEIDEFRIVAAIRFAQTKQDGSIQFIIEDPTLDKFTMPSVKLKGMDGSELAEYVSRVGVFYGHKKEGKIKLTRVIRTNYEKLIA